MFGNCNQGRRKTGCTEHAKLNLEPVEALASEGGEQQRYEQETR